MIHNTAAKRRSKTHLTFVGCVLLCARDGICIYNRQHTKERRLYVNSWGKTKMEKGRSSFRLLLFELND